MPPKLFIRAIKLLENLFGIKKFFWLLIPLYMLNPSKAKIKYFSGFLINQYTMKILNNIQQKSQNKNVTNFKIDLP